MALNPNQFKLTSVKGFVEGAMTDRLLPAKIADTEAKTLPAGSFVEIADVASKVLPLVGTTAEATDHAGVLVISTHRAEYKAGEMLEFAPCGSGAIVVMEAGGAISNGAKVYAGGDNYDKVVSAGTIVVGHAFDKATSAGDLIRVILDVRA